MKTVWMTALVVAAAFLSGCVVQSWHPFYTETGKMDVSNLDGEWVLVRENGKDVTKKEIKAWEFEEGATQLRIFDEEGRQGNFETVFFRVSDHVFCDLTPAEPPKKARVSGYWLVGMRPAHLLCKVDSGDGLLTLTPLDIEWLKAASKKKLVALPYVGDWAKEDDAPLFTATSEQWKAFLEQYGGDTGAFPEKGAFALKRDRK